MTVTVTTGTSVLSTYAAFNTISIAAMPYASGGSVSNTFTAGQYPWWTVQVTGTFGSGGSVQAEASNDGGTTWAIVGSAITSAKIVSFSAPAGALLRFEVTAGDGTTALNVYVTQMGVRG